LHGVQTACALLFERERPTREAAHDGLGGKQQIERLDGTDDVTT
jgi:hypothetical protein